MKKIKNILILAGGDSTRFWPLTKKSYFSFLGKPLVYYLIDKVKQFTDNLTIVINSTDVQSINRLHNSKIKIILQEKKLIGQAGAIISAKNKIMGEVLVMNAEDLFNFEVLHQL